MPVRFLALAKMSDNLVTNGHHLISLCSVNKVATSSSALMTLALALVRAMKFIERPYSSATQPPLTSASRDGLYEKASGSFKAVSKGIQRMYLLGPSCSFFTAILKGVCPPR